MIKWIGQSIAAEAGVCTPSGTVHDVRKAGLSLALSISMNSGLFPTAQSWFLGRRRWPERSLTSPLSLPLSIGY